MSKKTALITGITGQDGSFLAELLLEKNYQVHGIVRRASQPNLGRIQHIAPKLQLHAGDLTDSSNLQKLIRTISPDEVYNLAAQSHVHVSFEKPEYTADVDGVGVLRMLEAIRQEIQASGKAIRFYQAGTSELFGSTQPPQSEETPFHPRSPYACAKLFAHWQTINYRESYQMFACNGILFNHESERRGEEFVTRKITRAATRIKLGLQTELRLGNLDAKRDWGYAGDYVEAMYSIINAPNAGDYVVATGESRSVREFCQIAFSALDLDYERYVVIDPKFYRPAEVNYLLGDPTKIFRELGWKPRTSFARMIEKMIEGDLLIAKRESQQG